MPDNENKEDDIGGFSRQRARPSAVEGIDQDARLQEIFDQYGLSYPEASRISRNVFAAALPLLARGGHLVFREPDGVERSYAFPSLSKTEGKSEPGEI